MQDWHKTDPSGSGFVLGGTKENPGALAGVTEVKSQQKISRFRSLTIMVSAPSATPSTRRMAGGVGGHPSHSEADDISWSFPKLFGRERRAVATSDPYLAEYLGQKSSVNAYVDTNRASGLPVAAGCISIIANNLASIPLNVYRRAENGGRAKATNAPLFGVMHDMFNDQMTAYEGREYLIWALLTNGNAYARIETNRRGQVVALYPVNPALVAVERLESGRLRYRISDQKGHGSILLQEEILHLRYRLAPDGITDNATYFQCRRRIPRAGSALNIVKFSKRIEVLTRTGRGSIFAALSADASTKMGLSPSFVVYDELGTAPKRDQYEALDTAMGARDNPLLCVISTQAASDHAVMPEPADYGKKVNSGEIDDPSFHLTFYGADDNRSVLLTQEEWLRCETDDLPGRSGPAVIGIDPGGSPSMSGAGLYWPETRRLEAVGAFPGKPNLEAQGEVDAAGDLYVNMHQRKELEVLDDRTIPIGPDWPVFCVGSKPISSRL